MPNDNNQNFDDEGLKDQEIQHLFFKTVSTLKTFGVIEYSRFLAFVDRCVFGLITALNIYFLEAFEDFTGAVWCILLLSLAWV